MEENGLVLVLMFTALPIFRRQISRLAHMKKWAGSQFVLTEREHGRFPLLEGVFRELFAQLWAALVHVVRGQVSSIEPVG